MTRQKLRIKRAYEPPDAGDGARVLVDRLWPRGLFQLVVISGLEVAPSRGVAMKLAAQSALHALLDRLSRGPVTLLFAARDETRNNAVALMEWLEKRVG